MILHIRELKYAMSASGTPSFPHPIGILMAVAGRFVVCVGCHLRVEFPAGAHFDIIARQFDSHLCGSPCLLKDDAVSTKLSNADDPASEALNCFEFDHNATPMWIFDISTLAFSAVNDAAVNHYGYSRKEFLSMTTLDIGPSEDIAPLLTEILQKRILNSGKELRKHKRKDGSLIDVEVTRRELLFKGRISDIVTAVDVTGYLLLTSSHPSALHA